MCYPGDIRITEIEAEVKLQSLLGHTIKRLVMVEKESIIQAQNELQQQSNVISIFKWGCDGFSDLSRYKQKFTAEFDNDDSFMFVVSIVPLQIKCGDIILWDNKRPSSTRYCRPIRIILEKESTDLVIKAKDSIVPFVRYFYFFLF